MAPTDEPTLSYIVCATPRTGSYLLCEGLTNTGVTGRPTEYLSGPYEDYWRPRWKVATYPDYLGRVKTVGRTPNGVFGVKVHPVQLDHFAGRVGIGRDASSVQKRRHLDLVFPGLRYVWIRRSDKLSQGISYAKALQSRIWWDADKPPAPFDAPRPEQLKFDRVLLERCVTQMILEDNRWERFFEENDIEPLVVNYEKMVQDIPQTIKQVTGYLDLELPDGFVPPPSKFRRQADSTTKEWRAQLDRVSVDNPAIRMVRRRPVRGSRPTGTVGNSNLNEMLANRRWWKAEVPFTHFRARGVFRPEVYGAIEAQFLDWLDQGRFKRDIPGYDVSAMAVTADDPGEFSVFVSREWHDMVAGLVGVEATGELNVTLHHHGKGSSSGTPHNDLNPAFFAEVDRRDGIVVADPARCNYRQGTTDLETVVTERVRAVAVLFYLAQHSSARGPGGETGLYRMSSQAVQRPTVAVPPVNNSLVAFECTPYSYHSFITNPHFERNCVVMWLHRSKDEVHRRWGGQSIVRW